MLDAATDPGHIVAGYAWRSEPMTRAGEMRIEREDGSIHRLVVTFAES